MHRQEQTGWDQRIRRCDELIGRESAAQEVLRFYRRVIEVQRSICEDISKEMMSKHSQRSSFRERLDADCAVRSMPAVLAVVRQDGPSKLAKEAERIEASGATYQRQVLLDWLNKTDSEVEFDSFFARVIWQPMAEHIAATSDKVSTTGSELKCPFCGGLPQLAVLRPAGDGGKRHLQCSFCLTEWEFRRVLCAACGEVDYRKLPRYSPEEPNVVRVEACDTCKFYLKSFDLTADGRLVPEVDEIATAALDVWAVNQGYRKIHPNVTGF